MSITQESFASYLQQVRSVTGKRAKRQAVATVCGVVGSLAFLLVSLLLTYCEFVYLDSLYPAEEQVLSAFAAVNELCQPVLALLQFGVQPWYIVLILCIAALILIPLALNIVFSVLVLLFYKSKPLPEPEGNTATKLTKLLEAAEEAGGDITDRLKKGRRPVSWLYTLAVAAFFGYGFTTTEIPSEKLLPTVLGLAVCAVLLYWVYRIPLTLFCSCSKPLWHLNKTPAKNLAQQLQAELSAEYQRIKEEDARKMAEQERLQAEQARQLAQERREKADVLYQQAIAGEPYDEALMEEAADLGSPEACLYLGKQLVEQWSSGLLTRSEKDSVIRDAAEYLEVPAQTDTEARFLWLMARTQYESNTQSQWEEMLQAVRKIKASGQLPENYAETCDTLLKTLVEVIDNVSEKIANASREPVLKRKYCRFNNAGICTRLSTGSSLAHCDYMDNPGSCSTALLHKGLAFEFE